MKYSTKDLAQCLTVSPQAVNKRANREGWSFVEEKKEKGGGKKRLYLKDSLPESVQAKISIYELKRLARAAEQNAARPTPTLPVSKAFSAITTTVHPAPQHHPKEIDKAALKVDLIYAYREAKDIGKQTGQGKVAAAEEFCRAYNTGVLLPQLYKVLGSKSRATLERWSKSYHEAENDCVVLIDRHGHRKGQTKVTEEEGKTLLSLLLHQNRIPIGTAINLMRYVFSNRGKEVCSSDATLRRYVQRFKSVHRDIWTLSREGEKALRDKILPYIERDASLLKVGDVLVADGHRLNARVINPFTGKPVRAALILWLDWASRDVAGFEIMIEEDIYAIHTSLYRAIKRLGKLPEAVLLDNGKAFKAKVFTSKDIDIEKSGTRGLYARLGILTSFAWPYNARSKPVERFFGTMGLSFERMLPSFVGASIDDKPARLRRNEKFMQELSPEWIPTIPEMCRLLEAWLDFYRSRPHQGLGGRLPGEVFEAGRGPGVDPDELRLLMTHREIRHLGRNGITFLGSRYWHESLYGLHQKVLIRYDIQDLRQIWVYDMDGQYLGQADRVESLHPMHALTGSRNYPELKHELKKQRDLANQTKKVVALAARQGKTDELDKLPWNEIIGTRPEIADQVEGLIGENEPEEKLPPLEAEPVVKKRFKRGIDPVDMSWMTDEEINAAWEKLQTEKGERGK